MLTLLAMLFRTMLFRIRKWVTNTLNSVRLPAVAREVKRRHLSYLSDAKFLSLRDVIREIKSKGLDGDFVEYGVALGGSAVYLASELSERHHFHGYDVFGMIPAPGEQDDEKSKARYELIRSGSSEGLGGELYYGYQENLFHRVCETFKSFGMPVDGVKVTLYPGLFENTVRFSPDDRVALAHLDCDWYEPVRVCLERTRDVICRGGFMILDDYNDYGGCRKAADEFLSMHPQFTLVRTLPHAVIRRD
jgi:asparagine synthase (glutamine-hydrolysing)